MAMPNTPFSSAQPVAGNTNPQEQLWPLEVSETIVSIELLEEMVNDVISHEVNKTTLLNNLLILIGEVALKERKIAFQAGFEAGEIVGMGKQLPLKVLNQVQIDAKIKTAADEAVKKATQLMAKSILRDIPEANTAKGMRAIEYAAMTAVQEYKNGNLFDLLSNQERDGITHYKDTCPHCGSEDFEMVGDPEYNDQYCCNACKKEFSSFNSEPRKG
jgi:hypothetical protein